MSTLPADYAAALTSAALYPIPAAGYLRFGGADRSDFLNRQTTNDLRLLAPGRSLTTVLTTPVARIQDVLILVAESDQTLAALTLPGRAAATFAHLRSKIFFMDKVTVHNISAEFVQFDLIGPQAGAMLAALGIAPPAEVGDEAPATLGNRPGRALRLHEGALRLLIAAEEAAALRAGLEAAGAAILSAESYDTLRVEAGRPAADHECTEAFTPLEAGLRSAISDRKGCYTGQEIIARQITYDKVTRELAGLRISASSVEPSAAPLQPGDVVHAEGKAIGAVTSAALSPRFGPLALAILKRPWQQPGERVHVGETETPAEVCALPFA